MSQNSSAKKEFVKQATSKENNSLKLEIARLKNEIAELKAREFSTLTMRYVKNNYAHLRDEKDFVFLTRGGSK